jgi:hypothetical protein
MPSSSPPRKRPCPEVGISTSSDVLEVTKICLHHTVDSATKDDCWVFP